MSGVIATFDVHRMVRLSEEIRIAEAVAGFGDGLTNDLLGTMNEADRRVQEAVPNARIGKAGWGGRF